jgi:Ferritin-like
VLDASVVSDEPRENLQLGLGIELSVLPPYLYALWSIKPPSEGASDAAVEAANSIRAVAYEEMLHAGLVGNVLNALRSKPQVTANLMTYPGPLPGHTSDPKYAFDVGLAPLSADTVATFMLIERPDWVPPAQVANGWITIGEFYEKVRKQLAGLPAGSFGGGCQVPLGDNPGPGQMVQVDSLKAALDAIETVVEQGEGHRPPPDNAPPPEIDDDHEVAHYYQFLTIHQYLKAGRIDATRDLYPVIENPDAAIYSAAQQQANTDFNTIYTALLDSLQATFESSAPRAFGQPTDLMTELEHAAAVLRDLGPVPGTNTVAGPTFEYLGATDGGP